MWTARAVPNVVNRMSRLSFSWNELIVELKAIRSLTVTDEVQTVNYLTATRIEIGYRTPAEFSAPSAYNSN